MDIKLLQHNTGQIPGVPKNPRLIKDEKYRRLVKSIQDDPEMLELRECIVFNYDGKHIVIAGNMRLTACRELGITDIPVKILPADTPPAKIRAYTVKDNVSFGEWDFDVLSADWDTEELTDWGVDMPQRWDGDEVDDPMAEYKGLPEFEKERLAQQKIIVYFKSSEDILAFADLINQKITGKTVSIWFPQKEKENLSDMEYCAE